MTTLCVDTYFLFIVTQPSLDVVNKESRGPVNKSCSVLLVFAHLFIYLVQLVQLTSAFVDTALQLETKEANITFI